MSRALRKIYFCLLMPPVLGLIVIFFAKTYGYSITVPRQYVELLAPLLFVLSVVFAIALPIFFRALFAHNIRFQKHTSKVELLKFERRLICIALVAPYLLLPAYLFEIPGFYVTGAVLMALYAAYYYYPSQKRMQFESRVFRVK